MSLSSGYCSSGISNTPSPDVHAATLGRDFAVLSVELDKSVSSLVEELGRLGVRVRPSPDDCGVPPNSGVFLDDLHARLTDFRRIARTLAASVDALRDTLTESPKTAPLR